MRSKRSKLRFGFARRLGLAPVLIAVILFAAASSAFAHSHPVSYDPAQNAMVSTPAAVTVHFSEALEPKFSSLKVMDAKGHQMNAVMSKVSASDAKVMSVALPKLMPGMYTVHWVSVALDGHRMEGNYTFTVKE